MLFSSVQFSLIVTMIDVQLLLISTKEIETWISKLEDQSTEVKSFSMIGRLKS